MSWRTGGPWFIAPGATVRVSYWWDNPGSDKGAQWAMGHPMAGESSAGLATERVGKLLECEIGQITINGPAEYSCAQAGDRYSYFVDIRNEGPDGCRFQLEGGGV